MNYKLIAVDLDGTLYNDEPAISPATIQALIKAQEMGIRVAISSGRPLPGLFHARDALNLQKYHGMLVSYNGGKVVDTTNHETLNDSMNCVEVSSLIDCLDFPLIKILTAIEPEKLPDVFKVIGKPYEGILDFVQSADFYIEAVPHGTSKATGLLKVCEKLGIHSDQIIAFGDAKNDLEMIKLAGHGVAMGNACDELKECADEVTLTNNENGIVHTLNHLIFS